MVNVKTSIYFFVFYVVYVFQKNLNIKHEQTKYDCKTIMLKTYYSKKNKKRNSLSYTGKIFLLPSNLFDKVRVHLVGFDKITSPYLPDHTQ